MTTCTHRCGCTLAHAPAQALADLLKAAVAVDEIATDVRDFSSRAVIEALDALHAAVAKLS